MVQGDQSIHLRTLAASHSSLGLNRAPPPKIPLSSPRSPAAAAPAPPPATAGASPRHLFRLSDPSTRPCVPASACLGPPAARLMSASLGDTSPPLCPLRGLLILLLSPPLPGHRLVHLSNESRAACSAALLLHHITLTDFGILFGRPTHS